MEISDVRPEILNMVKKYHCYGLEVIARALVIAYIEYEDPAHNPEYLINLVRGTYRIETRRIQNNGKN